LEPLIGGAECPRCRTMPIELSRTRSCCLEVRAPEVVPPPGLVPGQAV
jgi:hypothetical protein